ncbi:MAG: S9 family peptidase [Acidobacteria bacterium]|nr:S9 family peptidase [Acidobacteriota bacterium]
MKRTAVLFLLLLSWIPAHAQEDFITPGDNLVLDSIPPIPQSIADGIGRYTEFRSAEIGGWHPTRLEMLIGTRFADAAQVHIVKMPGGARTQLTFFPERVSGASFNPKNPAYFVFSKDAGGGEWYQNFRYDVESGDITLLTDGKSRNTLGVWAKDGGRMAYVSTRRTGSHFDLYVVDPLNPSSDRLLAENTAGAWWYPLDWSPDGRRIAVLEYVSVNESYIRLFDSRTGAGSLVTPKETGNQVFYGGAQFSRDGRGLYVTTDRDSEFNRLAYLDLETKTHTFLTEEISWDVDAFRLSPDGGTIAFVVNEDGAGVLRLMDISGNELPAPALPAGLVSGLQWHPSGRHLGFNHSSARSSSDVYSLETATGRVERWTFSETGGINTADFPQAELIKWKSFDGRIISGFLYRPPASFGGKRPVIVDIHGGPESQSRPDFLGRNNFYINELGIAMIYPNIRGSSGYGKTFLKLDNGFKREDSYRDVSALLDWIREQPGLDGERIMVTGGSYGGHMTLAVAAHYGDRIRCAVDVVGMSNLVTFLENTESYRRDMRRAEYGDEREPEMRKFMEKTAAMNNLDKLDKPLFVVQGKNDPRVPASESEQIVAALKKRGVPVWYLMATDEGHGFAKKKNQDFQFYATVMFIKNHLLQ